MNEFKFNLIRLKSELKEEKRSLSPLSSGGRFYGLILGRDVDNHSILPIISSCKLDQFYNLQSTRVSKNTAKFWETAYILLL